MDFRKDSLLTKYYLLLISIVLSEISPTLEQRNLASLEPNFGPEAGGTIVTISSKRIDVITITRVTTADQECVIITRSSNEGFQCTIGSRFSWMALNEPLDVTLSVLGGKQYILPGAFTYKPNPVINGISPWFSIISGGILLTVMGRNFDSISSIRFVIHTSFQGNISSSSISAPCTNHDTQYILCPTPEVRIPQSTSGQGFLPTGVLSNDYWKFLTGFEMEGFYKYETLSTTLPEYSDIKMYRDPVINRFKDGKYYHRPSGGQILNITGKYLNPPLSERDFRISIGNGYCRAIDLSSTTLSCQLPDRTSIGATPRMQYNFPAQVIIGTGKLNFTLGTLFYKSDIWSGSWPIIAGFLGFGAIFLGFAIAIIIFCVYKDKYGNRF